MRSFFHDFIQRLAKASAFANADNLGEALHLMQEGHLDEVEQRQTLAARNAAHRVMQRPPALRHTRGVKGTHRRYPQSACTGDLMAAN